MTIGIAAATSFEIEPTIKFLTDFYSAPGAVSFEILITGIGSVSTGYHIANFIKMKSPGFLIQAGICGALHPQLQLGQTVIVTDELIGDQGVEENNLYRDMFDMGFISRDEFPYSNGRLVNTGLNQSDYTGLTPVRGITVNEITTSESRIRLLNSKYQADIESMEGAAFHFVCLQEHVPFLQLRSVSNYVGERDKSRWQMKQSIANLNHELINVIKMKQQ